jgi:hypothetical protein
MPQGEKILASPELFNGSQLVFHPWPSESEVALDGGRASRLRSGLGS